MNIVIKGIIKGMLDMGCKLIKTEENKLYFEIPNEFTDKQIGLAKEAINHYGYMLFTKRVGVKEQKVRRWEDLGYSDSTMLLIMTMVKQNTKEKCCICGSETYYTDIHGVRLCSVECAEKSRVNKIHINK